MESSFQVSGDIHNECSMSESSWTKYLAPTIHNDRVDGDSDEDSDHRERRDDGDSDDSTASDARSGPCRREIFYNGINIRDGRVQSKNNNNEDDDEDVGYSMKKSYKPKEQRSHDGGKKKKDEKDPHGERNSSLLCKTSKIKKFTAGPRK